MTFISSQKSLALDVEVSRALHARDTTKLFVNLAALMREEGMTAFISDIIRIPTTGTEP